MSEKIFLIDEKDEWSFILLCIVIKHCVRRFFGVISSFHSKELADRMLFFTEHAMFSVWAYHCIYYLPEAREPNSSWLFNTPLLWVGTESNSPALIIFYLGKVGTHVEDLLFIFGGMLFPSAGGDSHSDSKMIVHHVATALLCIGSWCFGYLRIGSVVMLLHDVSDIPLDLVRLFGVMNQKLLQIASMVLTLLAWGYWRLYFFPFKVVRSMLMEGTYSPLDAAADPTGALFLLKKCTYIVLLGSLCVLHYLWYWLMLQKCYREVRGGGGRVEQVSGAGEKVDKKKQR